MIKLVAVDMDGTFLKSDMSYERERFQKLYREMRLNGIKFVVASGNQYYQLRSFFPQADELSFVAENGGYVWHDGKERFVGNIDEELVRKVLNVLEKNPEIEIILCGKNSAYTNVTSHEAYDFAHKYYHRLEKVRDFQQLPEDTFIKFGLHVPHAKVEEIMFSLEEVLAGQIIPVSSGHGDIDLIMPGVTKAHGLTILGELFDIQPEEMIAFGDSGNDKEMLEHVGFGFAMENGSSVVKSISTKIVPSNEEAGVLQTLEDFAGNQWEYPY